MTHVGRDQHRRVFTWTPMSYLGITQRFHTIAEREGWKIALDFYRMTDAELLKVRGLGKDALAEIRRIFPAPVTHSPTDQSSALGGGEQPKPEATPPLPSLVK